MKDELKEAAKQISQLENENGKLAQDKDNLIRDLQDAENDLIKLEADVDNLNKQLVYPCSSSLILIYFIRNKKELHMQKKKRD